jgi:hypothetical protein
LLDAAAPRLAIVGHRLDRRLLLRERKSDKENSNRCCTALNTDSAGLFELEIFEGS